MIFTWCSSKKSNVRSQRKRISVYVQAQSSRNYLPYKRIYPLQNRDSIFHRKTAYNRLESFTCKCQNIRESGSGIETPNQDGTWSLGVDKRPHSGSIHASVGDAMYICSLQVLQVYYSQDLGSICSKGEHCPKEGYWLWVEFSYPFSLEIWWN